MDIHQRSGINTVCTYTDADELASITYRQADNTVIATGSYTYDAAGHRVSVSGDLATFVQAGGADVTDAAYNVNNQLTTWSGKTFAYDKNGDMTSDGVSSYVWDARGQLASVTGEITATFQYDTARRRLAKTIGGTTTAYAYDGDNFVQELAGLGTASAVDANLLTGGIDQTFLRTTGTGSTAVPRWVRPDANNDTVILTDSTGTIQKTYAYDAYGNTTPGSGADANSQQYTGRENDGNGLYFYRNRYYLSGCMRFISEDPIGWASGQTNNYAYVAGNPVQFRDPTGNCGFDFNQFASQVESNRLDLAVTFGSLVAMEAVGTMPKVASELRGLGVAKSELNPFTSQLSRWAGRFGIRALRDFGRTATGIALGTVADAAVVFEGFYDWGVMGQAAWDATSCQ